MGRFQCWADVFSTFRRGFRISTSFYPRYEFSSYNNRFSDLLCVDKKYTAILFLRMKNYCSRKILKTNDAISQYMIMINFKELHLVGNNQDIWSPNRLIQLESLMHRTDLTLRFDSRCPRSFTKNHILRLYTFPATHVRKRWCMTGSHTYNISLILNLAHTHIL